jgi:hypothetical protein
VDEYIRPANEEWAQQKWERETGFIQSLRDNFFHSNCILNSFSALNNLPNQSNFSAILSQSNL